MTGEDPLHHGIIEIYVQENQTHFEGEISPVPQYNNKYTQCLIVIDGKKTETDGSQGLERHSGNEATIFFYDNGVVWYIHTILHDGTTYTAEPEPTEKKQEPVCWCVALVIPT